MRRTLVSIVMPCFNVAKWLPEAIESCLRQTYRPIEVIGVDDGSTDDTLDLVKSYASRHPDVISWASQEHRGPASARNRGLAMASGEYLQWLDADDLLEPGKIGDQVKFLAEHPNVDGVYGDWKDQIYSAKHSVSIEHRRTFPLHDFLLSYVSGKWAPVHAFLIRQNSAQRYLWDETLEALEDHDYWLQQALRGACFVYLHNKDCAVYRFRQDQSNRNSLNETWLRARLKLHRKTEASLREFYLLEEDKYRRAMARAYVGLAWRSFSGRQPELATTALGDADRLVGERELQKMEWPFAVCPFLGLKGSLVLDARRTRMKASLKRKLYPLLSFDTNLTWRDNFKMQLAELCFR